MGLPYETRIKMIEQLKNISDDESLDIGVRTIASEQILRLLNEPRNTIEDKLNEIMRDIENLTKDLEELNERISNE